jgi:hypothetical protein
MENLKVHTTKSGIFIGYDLPVHTTPLPLSAEQAETMVENMNAFIRTIKEEYRLYTPDVHFHEMVTIKIPEQYVGIMVDILDRHAQPISEEVFMFNEFAVVENGN